MIETAALFLPVLTATTPPPAAAVAPGALVPAVALMQSAPAPSEAATGSTATPAPEAATPPPALPGGATGADEALIDGRRRPGFNKELPDKVDQTNPGAVSAPPPEACIRTRPWTDRGPTVDPPSHPRRIMATVVRILLELKNGVGQSAARAAAGSGMNASGVVSGRTEQRQQAFFLAKK